MTKPKMIRATFFLLLTAGVLITPARAQQNISAQLNHAGRERTYQVHLPRGHETRKPAPLVLALHGGGSQGRSMINLTRFNQLADQHGFVVAYPDGEFRRWNDGRQSGVADSRMVDDVGFLSALIDTLAREYGIDRGRVYATGISNGGFMSLRLACDLADKITAIAPVAATMGRDLSARCKPSQPVSVLLIAGTEDPLVPYEGGRVQVRGGGAIVSADAAVERWVEINGCKAPPAIEDLLNTADDGTRTRRSTYPGCVQGSEVVFLRIEGGGHTWPGGSQYLPVARIGRASRDFDASEEIWWFFSRQARPGAP